MAGAVVRMQTTATSTISGSDGSFVLSGVPGGITITVTAWHEGYFPGGTNVIAPQSDVTITIRLHPSVDNPNHEWYTSMPDPEAAIGCGHCMAVCPTGAVTVRCAGAVSVALKAVTPIPPGAVKLIGSPSNVANVLS